MKNERLVKIGLGLGITSALVGVVAYQFGKTNKINNVHCKETDGILDKIESTVDNVVYAIKK